VESQFVKVVATVSPSVVLITTDVGLGSGIIYNSGGDIVTNDHVIAGTSALAVTLSSGRQYPATVQGAFPPDDVAVIRIHAAGIRPASFANSSKLAVGDFAMAIGNPLGLTSSVTNGIVSALGRTVTEPGGNAIPGMIQTSAPINPGNSGGALVSLSGQVIGIPTLAASTSRTAPAPGIGFAVSSNTARFIADQIIQHGKVVNSGRAYLGVTVSSLPNGGGGGVAVADVQAGGPAGDAGIRPGDTIIALDGTATPNADALATALAELKPGQTVSLELARAAGTKQTVMVTLGQLPG
jgi:S1-C subfamily serine protease